MGSVGERKGASSGADGGARTLAERLAATDLFLGMPPAQVAEVSGRAVGGVRRFEKGETVVTDGMAAQWLIVLLDGRLYVYDSGAGGERLLVRAVESGRSFGVTMMADGASAYSAMVVAARPSEAVFMDVSRLRDLWREGRHPRLFENLFRIAGEVALDGRRHAAVLACRKVEDRLMLELSLRAEAAGGGGRDVALPFATMEDCARHLGVTRTGLSLAVKGLVRRGRISRVSPTRFVIR